MFPLEENEKITAVVPVKEFDENHYVFMATAHGTVKKTAARRVLPAAPERHHRGRLDQGDYLVGAALTDGKYDVMLFSSEGKSVRFEEGDVADGPPGDVRAGISPEGQRVVYARRAKDDSRSVLTATANGYGKRTRSANTRATAAAARA